MTPRPWPAPITIRDWGGYAYIKDVPFVRFRPGIAKLLGAERWGKLKLAVRRQARDLFDRGFEEEHDRTWGLNKPWAPS